MPKRNQLKVRRRVDSGKPSYVTLGLHFIQGPTYFWVRVWEVTPLLNLNNLSLTSLHLQHEHQIPFLHQYRLASCQHTSELVQNSFPHFLVINCSLIKGPSCMCSTLPISFTSPVYNLTPIVSYPSTLT